MNQNKLLCLFLAIVFALFTTAGYTQYADLGKGALKNQIWWFDWNGFTMAEGATKTITTTDGLTVTIRFSILSGPTLIPSVMNTWNGAVLHFLYDFSDPNIKPALYFARSETEIPKFRLTISGTRNGVAVPFSFVVADAEASATTEITTLTSSGSAWNIIDFFRNSTQTSNPVIGCNTKTVNLTDTYGNAPEYGQNPVLSTKSISTSPLNVDVSFDHHGGLMGLAFGIFEGVDRGDLPASYGYAQHQIAYTFENSCNYLPPYPIAVPVANLKLGTLPGDADGIQTGNDNAEGVDEDALSSFPTYTGNGTYQLSLPVTNTTGEVAYVGAWFDFNRNGAFEAAERTVVKIPPDSTTADVSWSGVPAQLQRGQQYAFRFRITTQLNMAQSATGVAKDGEVEDYLAVIPQNAQIQFTAPDTVCVNTPVDIANTSVGASSYYWNFCVANASTNPVGTNLGNFGFTKSVFIDYAKDGNNYYAFVTNNTPGRLVRLDFGNSLLNTPTPHDFGSLGGVIPDLCEGIQVVQNEGRWYAIIVGGSPVGRIVKIDFGPSLANNAPAATNWGNIGNLAYPVDLHLFQDGDQWYGLTINAETSSITRFDFTNSFTNVPTGVNLGNIGGLNYPTGIYAINNNNRWYAFVSNAGSGVDNTTNASLTRLDFGTSLLNTPTGVNLGNPGNLLRSARDLTIYQSCSEIFGYVVNYSAENDIVRLNFSNSITAVPTAESIGNTGDLRFPHCISKLFRVENDLYSFVANVDNNTITRLKFSGCNGADIPGSTLQNPPAVTYTKPGTYNINLIADDGLPTQSLVCRQVVVLPSVHTPTQRLSICTGDSVLLTSSAASGNHWNNGSTTTTLLAKTAGTYWVQSINSGGCVNIDSFEVALKQIPTVNLGSDTALCLGDSLVLDAGNAGATYQWQNGQTTQTLVARQVGLYSVLVTKDGCSRKDTITIQSLPLPVVHITGKTTICQDGKTDLSANGGVLYNWSPATGLTSSTTAATTASPAATTKYYVNVTGQNGCRAKDSVTVTVTPKPVFTVSASQPVLCLGDTAILTATGGDTFTWSPAASLSNPSGSVTKASPQVSTSYKVVITEKNCAIRDSLYIDLPVANKPSVTTTKSNDINCVLGEATLHTGGGSQYLWQPATGLSDPTSNNPIVRIQTTTTYHLFVTTNDGCKVEDSITVYVVNGDNGEGFPVPNAFTPNGDGKNDCFGLKHWGDVTDFSMRLYNRWGQLVFQTNQPTECWNGFYKGKLQSGDVYVYLIKAKTRCGDVFRKGTFTLIR